MKATPIPPRVRAALRDRDPRCLRCGTTAGGFLEVHHRRRRGIRGADVDPHSLDNCIRLCRSDHTWAHREPGLARESGLIVSSYEDDVENTPIQTYYGWVLLHPDGSITWAPETST